MVRLMDNGINGILADEMGLGTSSCCAAFVVGCWPGRRVNCGFKDRSFSGTAAGRPACTAFQSFHVYTEPLCSAYTLCASPHVIF
jgi:hypothetical protein